MSEQPILTAAGIMATIPNEHTLGVAPFYGHLVGGVRVMVPPGDLTRARDVLAATAMWHNPKLRKRQRVVGGGR